MAAPRLSWIRIRLTASGATTPAACFETSTDSISPGFKAPRRPGNRGPPLRLRRVVVPADDRRSRARGSDEAVGVIGRSTL